MARHNCADCIHKDVCALWEIQNEISDTECVHYQPTLTPPNEPLTLEKLREMDGDPVWIEDVKHWALIDIEKGGQWDGVPFAIWAENGMKFTYNIKTVVYIVTAARRRERRTPDGQ